jgi:Zn-dependent M28 family amino/carboxypeptidase
VAERQAADYIAAELAGWTWDVTLRAPVHIPGTDLETCNVVATYPGHAPAPTVIVGAHIDSYCRDAVSPGANDNASGVAVALELARVLRHRALPYCLKLVFFGGEETTREAPRAHHVGSAHFVAGLDGTERAQTAAMLSVDMVGAGKALHASRLGLGSDRARGWLLGAGEALGLALRSDTGRAWSDHEAFERAGVPSVWLTRIDTAPAWHTPEDSYEKVGREALLEAGRLCVRFLLQAEQELGHGSQSSRVDGTP